MANQTVLLRCDASPEIGFGHLFRCLAIARQLRDAHGCHVVFLTRPNEMLSHILREAVFDAIEIPASEPPGAATWIRATAERLGADALVIDVTDALTRAAVESMADDGGLRTVTIDDWTERRLGADLVFLGPEPQALALDWVGARGTARIGWDWIPLRLEYADLPQGAPPHVVPRVLVTMGGSDPGGLTVRAVRALDRIERPVDVTTIVGPGYQEGQALGEAVAAAKHPIRLIHAPGSVRSFVIASDLVVLSHGVTSYEVAACAVPQVALCLTMEHVTAAEALVGAGAAVSLGLATEVPDEALTHEVSRLIDDEEGRSEMGRRARHVVDGRGVERICRVIAREVLLGLDDAVPSDTPASIGP